MGESSKERKRQLVSLKLDKRKFVRNKDNGKHGKRSVAFKDGEGDTGSGSR